MHVPLTDIHPDLRRQAIWFRLTLPSFTRLTFRAARPVVGIIKGWHTRSLRCEQHYLPRPDRSRLRLCIYAPQKPAQGVPGILWMHGGGYALGTPEQSEIFIKRFVQEHGCVVAAPDYTLSIDAPYPAALEDCYAALLWLKRHGAEYGMRDDQIMVGGDSAGGGLTAALTLYARDRREVAIAFQMPIYPMIDDRMDTESARDNDAPAWDSKSNAAAWQLYLGDLFGTADVPPYAAPARASDLSGLPPACSYVGSVEPFYDETALYFDRLRESGVPVHFRVFDGCFHAFDMMCPRTGVAREAVAFLMDTFRYAAEHYFAAQPEGR